jgi:RNA polymerase sigma-70 factor, ECF subfamily
MAGIDKETERLYAAAPQPGDAALPGHTGATPPKPPPSFAAAEPQTDLDAQLMLQVRAGDRAAAETLVRRNRERIERYIARLVRQQRAVEDLTQDTFLQALRHAEHYEPTARFSTWLYRIATNVALNYLKQPAQRRQVSTAPEALLASADLHEPAPDAQLSLDELRAQVSRAVDRLPVNQRVALTLFEYEDCSYEQIAAVLDATVEAVRSLLMRARTTLRRELNGLV